MVRLWRPNQCLISSSLAAPGLSILFPSTRIGALATCSSVKRLWNQWVETCTSLIYLMCTQNILLHLSLSSQSLCTILLDLSHVHTQHSNTAFRLLSIFSYKFLWFTHVKDQLVVGRGLGGGGGGSPFLECKKSVVRVRSGRPQKHFGNESHLHWTKGFSKSTEEQNNVHPDRQQDSGGRSNKGGGRGGGGGRGTALWVGYTNRPTALSCMS